MVGHRLFDRTTRGVRLTLAGQLLAERARGTIEKVHDGLAQVRRLGRGEEGTLTVGFSGSVMFTDLPAAIENYRRRYPKVELCLRELVTSAQIAALLEGTIDLAFLRWSALWPPGWESLSRRLASQAWPYPVRSTARCTLRGKTSIDLGIKEGSDITLARNFAQIAG